MRLSQQTTKPALVTPGVTVTAFATAARDLRIAQETAMTNVETARAAQEQLRVAAATALFGMVGFAQWTWRNTELRVDGLFDVNMLRGPAQAIPAAPADILWASAERRLATTELPAGATRLEGWRLGPGCAPECLAVGETDAAFVIVPADIIFDPGKTYQLWLTARNSRGTNPASPIQTWLTV